MYGKLEKQCGIGCHMNYDEFYQSNYWKVYRYCIHRGITHHDAEELTQEIFLYCYRHFSEYNPQKSAITTWLYLVASSRFKNFCRDRKITIDLDDIVELSDDRIAVEQAAEIDEMRRILTSALKSLPEPQRKLVILRYFSGMSTEEAAKQLGISSGNARVMLSRALKAMRIQCGPAAEGM